MASARRQALARARLPILRSEQCNPGWTDKACGDSEICPDTGECVEASEQLDVIDSEDTPDVNNAEDTGDTTGPGGNEDTDTVTAASQISTPAYAYLNMCQTMAAAPQCTRPLEPNAMMGMTRQLMISATAMAYAPATVDCSDLPITGYRRL